jgi:hypothetical protein
MKRLNLRQAMEKLHELGVEVDCGNFETFSDFAKYYDAHYKPLLEQLSKEWSMADGAKRFIANDMLKLFAE